MTQPSDSQLQVVKVLVFFPIPKPRTVVNRCQVVQWSEKDFSSEWRNVITLGDILRCFAFPALRSFRPAMKLPGVQIDTAFSAFLQAGPLIEVAKQILGRGGGGGGGGRGGFRGGRGEMRGGRGGGRGGATHGGGDDGGDFLTISQGDIKKVTSAIRGCKVTFTHRYV